MKIHDGSKLLIIGDSITDCERKRPIGEGRSAIGNSYVAYTDALIQSTYSEKRIRIVNMGCSGDRVTSLEQRWQTDVVDLEPDWLCVLIGINDVWRNFDLPLITEYHGNPKNYEKTLETLIVKTLPHLKGLILMKPFFIEPNKAEPMRLMMDQYGDVIEKLAIKYDAVLVDTQKAFDNVTKYIHPMAISWDRVHPNETGRMIIAKALLNELDFDWNRCSI